MGVDEGRTVWEFCGVVEVYILFEKGRIGGLGSMHCSELRANVS